MKNPTKTRIRAFTLIEMLIVIAIIAILAVLGFIGSVRFIDRGRKVQAMAQFRDFEVGMKMFEVDYSKPPIPRSKRDTGWDTIYGDPGGSYSTQFLVAALAGEDKEFPYKNNETFAARDANPRQEAYMTFPFKNDNKGGVGPDGKLYDPWGREVMVAINGFNSPGATLVSFNEGQNDRRLHTWRLAEYTETRPNEQSYVFWSYGKDGKKGKAGRSPGDVVSFNNSDDVISW